MRGFEMFWKGRKELAKYRARVFDINGTTKEVLLLMAAQCMEWENKNFVGFPVNMASIQSWVKLGLSLHHMQVLRPASLGELDSLRLFRQEGVGAEPSRSKSTQKFRDIGLSAEGTSSTSGSSIPDSLSERDTVNKYQ